MSIQVALNHKTHYRFDRRVSLSPHEVRLRPAPHCRTLIQSYSLRVRPTNHFINWQQDPYGNYVARLVFPEPATELEVVVDVVADMTVINPFDFFVEPSAERFPFTYAPQLTKELVPFLEVEPCGPLLGAWLERFKNADRGESNFINDFLVRLNQRLQRDIDYIVRLEPGVQTCEQTLQSRRGSCRDSGWLLVQILRNFGLAARFASGYLIQLVADVKPLEGPAGPKQDFTDLHAWAEVYIPGAGWIGLDPTSGLLAGEGHIPLACTASPSSAAPVIGCTDVCESELDFSMSVTRIHEDPRVTKPYTDEQWRAIETLGRQVDADLQAGDVRLTMGGEPTFVSSEDMEGAEWNFDALGPTKRKLAGDVLKRLKDRFAPGGLLYYGQGKWYPGEPLPRWALGCYWRLDGEPVWHDPALVADESIPYGYSTDHAQKFATRLAERLNLNPAYVIPAYEDVWHYLIEEQKLPVNVDPLQRDLKDPEQRHTLARLLDRGLAEVAGYVLPLRAVVPPAFRHAWPRKARWISGPWPLKRGRLYLLPGDSPMGYRLPLTSLPWAAPEDVEIELERDPLEAREPLGPARSRTREPGAPDQRHLSITTSWAVGESAQGVPRTALCVEVRQGRLHVFMPPQSYLEDYLDLVRAVEETAAELHSPLWVEGYPPAYDPRLQSFKVTPDPGVIEVNIHPAKTWEELVSNTHILYEEAHQSRLSTEKFMLDGRHTGTGGGNHVTLGGLTPADSPMLRRPDLLRSLTTYWLNHPGLSYLFSGMFVGPTSQAPRVDEARHDHLYELEIAFQQLTAKQPAGQETVTPWLVDRLLRHLFVDLTGNTHRAEFSIDKLYSPDSAMGRLGLVEFRAFEMPPHPQMSLSQMLLLRALVAKFWKQPYQAQVVHWGTELHDRFMLPHFVAQDMKDVMWDLQTGGYPFRGEWFAPFLEFRFPRYGSVVYEGIELELRQAIEPWHVLGEEAVAGATARYVDSSVERVQVKVNGMTDTRHVVTCNGRPVPLHPTGTCGEFVAGVRYQAWQPPSGLHPTIPVQSPLVFDLVDTWTGRAIGGCTYHVVHPGGRSSPSFPVNANAAEARRMARFWNHGHTPGPMTVRPEARNRAFPFTLDLRRKPAST
jgi:uncharacterized protein (DUF2126 family)/transglutaminase-like putative cysteine protease